MARPPCSVTTGRSAGQVPARCRHAGWRRRSGDRRRPDRCGSGCEVWRSLARRVAGEPDGRCEALWQNAEVVGADPVPGPRRTCSRALRCRRCRRTGSMSSDRGAAAERALTGSARSRSSLGCVDRVAGDRESVVARSARVPVARARHPDADAVRSAGSGCCGPRSARRRRGLSWMRDALARARSRRRRSVADACCRDRGSNCAVASSPAAG